MRISLTFLTLISLIYGFARADAAEGRPNILFCIMDDASYPHTSAYGTPWIKTPGFDRLAKEGLLFNRAYTPNAKCAASRAIVLTGRNSWQLESAGTHVCVFPSKFKTWPEALLEGGYQGGKTGKGWGPGSSHTAEGKGRELIAKNYGKRKTKPPANRINSQDYAANFNDFLDQTKKEQPWFFWYGATEPHRAYEYESGVKKNGRKLSDIDRVPGYWPDCPEVRNDMLDYALEIEHADRHLLRMIEALEKRGTLEHTLIVMTSDNGMPFPRGKANAYEISNHMPLAIRWGKGIKNPGRKIDDYVSFIDYAPTFLEAAGIDWEKAGMSSTPGTSLFDIFTSEKSGQVSPGRDHVVVCKERHDIGRPGDKGYPIRGLYRDGRLYLNNYATDRWPAGHPLTGYLDVDGGATKTKVLNLRREGAEKSYWQACFGQRPEFEFFDLEKDPDCMKNLANNPEYGGVMNKMKSFMESELKKQEDPRMFGNGDIFDSYKYISGSTVNFYERKVVNGEKIHAGWINQSDYETEIPK